MNSNESEEWLFSEFSMNTQSAEEVDIRTQPKGKKIRFRFTEAERIRALKELFNILCEAVCETEQELWENLKQVLCHDNSRFEGCSVRLLREHMLEQVTKYRKYDSEEATESGKERMKTEWGDTLRTLLTVWTNYETIVKSANEKKMNKGGRPRRNFALATTRTDNELAKTIRESALQIIQQEANTYTVGDASIEIIDDLEANESFGEDSAMNFHNYASTSNVSTLRRQQTSKAFKSRNCKEDGAFLLHKSKMESQDKKEALQFSIRQHEDNLALRREELAFKRRKLEYEERKLEIDAEQRRQENERNNKLTTLLETILSAQLKQ